MNVSAKPVKRWIIAGMGTVLQLCLGTVYAWSYFQKPVMAAFGWTNSQTAWTFSLAICFLGLAAAWGGQKLPKIGPRKLALAGGTLFASGYLIAAFALHLKNLPLLWAGYGVIGGAGLGLGYVTPVATAAKWFPDRKGLVTGMVIMGFGFGALAMSKLIAPVLMAATGGNLVTVFLSIGVLMFALTLPAAAFMENPPAGYSPPGWKPPAPAAGVTPAIRKKPAEVPDAKEIILSRRFLLMWMIFFMNIAAGIMFIGFQSPMVQDLLLKNAPAMNAIKAAAAGATLIALSSVFNGLGRFLWGGVSDRIGQIGTFRLILGTQFLVFIAFNFVSAPLAFSLLVCYVLLCYGGGFGAMPAFVLDEFGAAHMPVVYGTILTAWSAAGIAGPQIVAALKDRMPMYAATATFAIGAALLASGFALTFLLGRKKE
ncbi:MAG: MFS transporter [Treponema sp. GWB1_62_6]|nr:MAG: MFS transporter [Treponema sp. GWA1_62_8]OHE66765.1 MAG: MFS transporter [Treponema sp. GWB1_62_6]OHE68078.1 MAG: MFS transporter [Treponema sp. GWC1_61_84]HCM28251.1 MFS transporter [Treponema sp.]